MKAPIRRLDSLTHNDTAATKLINDNFEALQQGIEDSLSRTGKTPNFMDAVLDMNMNRIINIADPVDDYDLANKHYVDEQVALERNRAIAAEALINGRIDGEINRATAAEGALRSRIDNIDNTLSGFGDVVTHDADEFATAEQGAKADTALQPGDLPAIGNGTISLVQGGVLKGTFTVNQDSNEIINLDAGGGGGGDTSVIEIYPVSVNIAEGSTTASVNVTSSVDLSKNYLPIAIFHEVSTTNVLKYCSYTHSSSAASVHFFSNGHIVGDTGVAVYLIPVESGLTTVRGLTNGLGEVTTAVADYVTTNTVQDILSRKTFFGEKAIYFKQTASTDKLGFTLYNEADLELGAFEFRPNTISGSAFLNVNTSSSINTLLGFRYWGGGNGTNIIAPKISAGNYFIPLKISDGTTTVQATNTGVVNIYSLLPTIVSSVSSASTNSEAVGAKLFYDTCGDIEALINAL